MITLSSFYHTPRLAELKVSYRRTRKSRGGRETGAPVITRPVTAVEYLRSVWNKDTLELREEFLVVCLNTRLEVLGWVRLSVGGMNTAPVDVRLVFAVALQTASAAILVAHNHPSGSLSPSAEDAELTRRLKDGAHLLGLQFLDHVILTRDAAYSFSEGRVVSM